ncbi:MAG: HAD family hydrolase [Clostridia bacterium]|nr:HAD family hydrolase [Clostridia bacterium]
MAKTLYISDLDGTLLKNNQTLSPFTLDTVNGLTEKGVLFSYATARSYYTSSVVTKGFEERIPVIVYNGTFILDGGKPIYSNAFKKEDAKRILASLEDGGIFPIVYAFIDGCEKFSYIPHQSTTAFLDTRRGDGRDRPVAQNSELLVGEIFHFSCIDKKEKLEPLYNALKEEFTCVHYKEAYGGEWWLEIQPKVATKANAVLRLKEMLGCDRIVCFGDGKNDISMFSVCDECYAVENADDELKKLATDIIESNERDGVAKWLIENC